MHDGLKPAIRQLTSDELVALAANPTAHPKALGHELMTTSVQVLNELALGEEDEMSYLTSAVPAELSELAFAELERRAAAVANLRKAMFS